MDVELDIESDDDDKEFDINSKKDGGFGAVETGS